MSQTDHKNQASGSSFLLQRPLRFVGTATSDWQMNPSHDQSEWGEEVKRALRGEETGIQVPVMREELPSSYLHERKILDAAAELGGNAIRISLDFAELCPEPGLFLPDVMARSIRTIVRCRILGLTPIVTLHHWTYPKRFAAYDSRGGMRRGALEHPDIVAHFRFYVQNVAASLFDRVAIREALAGEPGVDTALWSELPLVTHFITLNEPVCMTVTPYVVGDFPPYRRHRFLKALKLEGKLKAMHRIAYEALHEAARAAGFPDERTVHVGMTHNVAGSMVPFLNDFAGWGLVERMQWGVASDFVGLQYYCRSRLNFRLHWPFLTLRGLNPHTWSDFPDTEVYPRGLEDILRRASHMFPGMPLWISEFGFADRTDRKRPAWILDSVASIIRAANGDVPVTGALLWTLTDNFEWQYGMKMRFGLYGKDGGRLPSDDGSHLSSREAWSACGSHLLHPTAQSAAHLAELSLRAHEQLEEEFRKNEDQFPFPFPLGKAA
ncbi:MAG: family 1 glycosylhydrolase [Candidatus Peribacteraceae bacterium]|jgi:beta-glucosidase